MNGQLLRLQSQYKDIERFNQENAMAKGQMKSGKEVRKPKKTPPVKTIAAKPSTKGTITPGG